MPVSVTPWLREPVGLTSETGALVAAGNGVGLPESPPVDGTGVAWGPAVGEGAPLGVAVAEDPQANNRATNNRTIALGKCFMIWGPLLDFGMVPSPYLRVTTRYLIV